MRKLVHRGKVTPSIRFKALEIVDGNNQHDLQGELLDIFYFVRDKIRYVKDIRGVETLHTPEKVLEFGQGDCDDKSVLLASLLETVGIPTRFVAIGFAPGRFDHVYVEAFLRGQWIPLETTEPMEPGEAPRGVTRLEMPN